MEMRTKQFVSAGKPKENQNEIGILIKCLECGKGRVFKVTEQIKLVYKDRTMDKFKIETECEGCSRKIEVSFGWITRESGFSYRDFKKSKELSVEDENGLWDLK